MACLVIGPKAAATTYHGLKPPNHGLKETFPLSQLIYHRYRFQQVPGYLTRTGVFIFDGGVRKENTQLLGKSQDNGDIIVTP